MVYNITCILYIKNIKLHQDILYRIVRDYHTKYNQFWEENWQGALQRLFCPLIDRAFFFFFFFFFFFLGGGGGGGGGSCGVGASFILA